jgi:hypothetical protein
MTSTVSCTGRAVRPRYPSRVHSVNLVTDDDSGRRVEQNEGAVRQIGPRQPVKASAVGPANDPLAMQLPIHHLRRRHIDCEPLGPGLAIAVVTISPAFGARAMSGSERDRFVVEVQERVVMRLPLLIPAPSELKRAGDREVACVEADDLVTGVKDAPVARPRTPSGIASMSPVGVTRLRAGVTVSPSHFSDFRIGSSNLATGDAIYDLGRRNLRSSLSRARISDCP